MAETPTAEWLLEFDAALDWQVERDLLGAPAEQWQASRGRVASEGFGARLLALQDDDGQWAGGSFFPSDFDWSNPERPGQPWTATTWSLNSLREWGLHARVLAGTAEKLTANSRWDYNGAAYWDGEVDVCINSWTLSNGLWLGADVDGIVDWFLGHQLADGGWNCEWVEGATASSFHSTLNALRGLLEYAVVTGDDARVADARREGAEYLLARSLFRRLSTGEVVGPWALHLGYPFRWRYSVLNAADYFRAATLHDGTAPDSRMTDAIAEIRSQRQVDGTWLQAGRPPGREWFEIDVPAGRPSKWVTFFAERVLRWWDAGAPG